MRHDGRDIELIYRARDYSPANGWSGRAPVLWPAVGRNFARGVKPDPGATECSYDWKGRRYEIPIHGFVRTMPWIVERQGIDDNGAYAVLSVRDTPETLRQYPFAFRLSVEYRLSGGELSMRYMVEAGRANREPMFFSIGNHITLRTPFLEGTDPLAMLFESPSAVEYLKDPTTLPSGKKEPRSFLIPVPLREMPTMPAVSLGGYRGEPWMRLADPAGLALVLSHEAERWPAPPVVQFNIWGDPANGFISPEPWVGLQNSFVLRKGLVSLKPGGSWSWTMRLRPERRAQ